MNLSLQFFSSDDKASSTLSGFSSLVSAARHKRSLACCISTSDAVDAVVVDERQSAWVHLAEVAKDTGVENAPTDEAAPTRRTKLERRSRAMMR